MRYDLLKERAETEVSRLKTVSPLIFGDWRDSFQAVFHLTEDIAGKIDGTPIKPSEIPVLYKGHDVLSVYDHTYGCPTRCTYCGYFTKSPPDKKEILEKHIELKAKEREIILNNFPEFEVTSIYFGGGTPTILLSRLLKKLITGYFHDFEIADNAEITVEAHPSTITQAKLETLVNNNVNRLSVGIQSLDKEILKECNRRYSPKQAIIAVKTAVGIFPIVNVDVIYGLQNQTIDRHLETLEKLVDLEVNQITAYAMWLKGGSKVFNDFAHKKTDKYPSPEERAKMYLVTKYFLERKGFSETTVGWFAKGGKEVKVYPDRWIKKIPCLGIGPGAYSYSESWHYNNVQDWKKYESIVKAGVLPIENGWMFGKSEKALVNLMWKIKTGAQFQATELESDLLQPFVDFGLISVDKGIYQITDLGKVVSEWVIGDMIRRYKK